MTGWLFVFFLVATDGSTAASVPADCGESFEDCRETCTLQFGASMQGREKLALCFGRCDGSLKICEKRHREVSAPPPTAPSAPRPVVQQQAPGVAPVKPKPPVHIEERPVLTVQPPKKKAN